MMHQLWLLHVSSFQDLLMKEKNIKANTADALRRNVDLFQFAFSFGSFDALLYKQCIINE